MDMNSSTTILYLCVSAAGGAAVGVWGVFSIMVRDIKSNIVYVRNKLDRHIEAHHG